jgi:hypothetical protein
LREIFPEDFRASLTQEEIIKHELLKTFEKVIIYLEETEDRYF